MSIVTFLRDVIESLNAKNQKHDFEFEDFELFYMAKKQITEQLEDQQLTLKQVMQHKCFLFAQQVRNREELQVCFPKFDFMDKTHYIYLTVKENGVNIGMEKKIYLPADITIK